MQVYMVRVALTNLFAEEHIKGIGDFWEKLTDAIPEVNQPKMLLYRFTFANYSLAVNERNECREIIKAAWKKVFPEEPGIAEILVTEYDEQSELSNMMRAIYNNFYGVDDYERMITEFADIIPFLKRKNAMDVLMQQNYLFAIDEGCGFTSLLSSLGDFFKKYDIFPGDGGKHDHYIEYLLTEKESENGYTCPDDLIGNLEDARGEENIYGVIGIDVSACLEGGKYDGLRAFLKRLTELQKEFVFVFRIPYLEKNAFDEIYKVFSDLMQIRPVQIPPLPNCVLMENVWNLLTEKGFSPDAELTDLVMEKIHQEKMDGRFYGFRTAEKIAQEIVLRKAVDYMEKIAEGEEPDKDKIVLEDVSSILSTAKVKTKGYAALQEMIGMEDITEKVREIIAQVKAAIENEKLERPCIHMRFTGAPGTGKTTVARIIGEIMREEGILRKGGFFEYTGRDLVAEYVGQTAVKTASICRDSYGSVLFIDEAYALCEGDSRNDFGKEAITTLISEMENHRDDMLVVMAGYTDEMDELMKLNPGIRSRMPRILHFPNYTKEQLFEIFMLMVKKHFDYAPELEEEAKKFFLALSPQYMDSKEFANARFVRNLYERTWSKAALRASFEGTREIRLTKEDFVAASSEKEFGEKIEQRKVLGF